MLYVFLSVLKESLKLKHILMEEVNLNSLVHVTSLQVLKCAVRVINTFVLLLCDLNVILCTRMFMSLLQSIMSLKCVRLNKRELM